MYICKECQTEYKEKPDFCECGNDEFDYVQEEKPVEAKPEGSIIKSENIQIKEQKIQKPKIEKRSFEEQYPSISRLLKSIDPISGGIFTLCIILSIYVIFFAWNVSEITISEKPQEKTTTVANIPNSVDKFWNNALPVVKQEIKQETVEKEVKKIQLPIQTAIVKKPVQQTVQKANAQKTTTVKSTKTTQTTKPAAKQTVQQTKPVQTKAQEQKTAQTNNVQTTTKPAVVQQKTAEQIAAEKAEAARKASQAKVELANYKAALRNAIGRKIDFTRVVGDGSCTVAFKINSSGKLTNRSFSKQSSNITLNDAVYAAVMATPSYNPPPSGYNNETLSLNISFYNGNFEISLR